MPSNQPQVLEKIVFDGSVSLGGAIALVVLAALLAGWLMWRERKSLGLACSVLFWVLRMTALVVALWMLLGPMQERTEQLTRPQSIAIFADGSNSMITVDPVEPTDAMRWSLATYDKSDSSPVTLCDRATVALRACHESCLDAQQQLGEHRPLGQLAAAIREIDATIGRVREYCNQLNSEVADYADLGERSERAEDLLNGPVTDALENLKKILDERNPSAAAELSESLENLVEGVASASRRLENLSYDVAATLAGDFDGQELDRDDWSRREKTAAALDSLESAVLSEMAANVQVQRYVFDEQPSPLAEAVGWSAALDAVGPDSERFPTTDLSAMLGHLATTSANESIRLALVVSDGHHNSLEATAPQEVASGLSDLPIYFVPVGNWQVVRDVHLHRAEAPSSVIQGDSTTIETIVTATNCDGVSTEIVLRHDGTELERKLVAFDGDRIDRRVQFQIVCEDLGWQDYEIEVELVDEEANTANNVLPVSLEVVRDELRVLLVDGISQYEYQYLHNLFVRDPHINHDELLFYPRVRGRGDIAARLRLPETVEDWATYDVVILGDINTRHFSRQSQEALVEYVRRRNGHLILIAGRDHMPHRYEGQPLMEVLPVDRTANLQRDQAHGISITEEGRLNSALAIEDDSELSEVTWENTFLRHPLYGLSEYSRPKETTRTLISAVPLNESEGLVSRENLDNLASFLCWQRVGSGRVVYLSSPQTYLLRFRRGDRLHHRFWGQMLRWITAAESAAGLETVRLSTNKNRYVVHEEIEVIAWLKDQSGRPLGDQDVEAIANTLDGPVETIVMEADAEVSGRYFGKFVDLEPGTYEIVLQGEVIELLTAASEPQSGELRKLITVDASDEVEMLDTSTNLALLEQVAKITGGQVLPPTAMSEVLQLASLSPEVSETVRRRPLWNRWTNLWIVFGCLSLEWVIRKQKGLV